MNVDRVFFVILILCSVAILLVYKKSKGNDKDFVNDEYKLDNIMINKNVISDIDKYGSELERVCCKTLSKIYNLKFEPGKVGEFEFTCYNDILKIAIEYRDLSHYEFENVKDFKKIHKKDMKKLKVCEENNIYLIVVPYNIEYDEVPSFIINRIPENV